MRASMKRKPFLVSCSLTRCLTCSLAVGLWLATPFAMPLRAQDDAGAEADANDDADAKDNSGTDADVNADSDDDPPADVALGVEENLFHAPVRCVAADGVIDSGKAWGHSGPWVEDVDGDGLKDLVVGDFSGLFRFYRNVGTNPEPRYEKGVNLQAGGVDALVRVY